MSRENVELNHRILDAFNRQDLEGFLALLHEDVEGVPRIVGSLGSRVHGHSGHRRWWRDLFDVLPDLKVEPVEVRDRGDVTLGLVRYRGHGAASDTPFTETNWLAYRWRGGKCISWCSKPTETEALEAVGLRE